jgi:hypothetical protein
MFITKKICAYNEICYVAIYDHNDHELFGYPFTSNTSVSFNTNGDIYVYYIMILNSHKTRSPNNIYVLKYTAGNKKCEKLCINRDIIYKYCRCNKVIITSYLNNIYFYESTPETCLYKYDILSGNVTKYPEDTSKNVKKSIPICPDIVYLWTFIKPRDRQFLTNITNFKPDVVFKTSDI